MDIEKTPPPGCRVVIADDHPIVRAGLARVIELQPGFRVVGQASDGEDACQQLKSQQPDVAVVDISMPKVDGFAVLAWAQQEQLTTRFVFLTQHADDAYEKRAQELGAMGYVHKDAALKELVAAIISVLAGRYYASGSSLSAADGEQSELPDVLAKAINRLTPTERSVLRYLAQNLTSKEIASAMNVSYRTVQNHRANICNKLDMRGNNRLLQFALEYRDQISAI